MGLAAPASTLWVGIGLYLAAVLAIGLWRAHQARQAEGFFVADRRAGTGLVSASLLATILGASATLGLSSKAWSDGLPAAWWLLSGVLGLLLLAFVFAARVRALGVYTLPEILEVQYGPAARMVASVLIVLSWLGITAGQIVGIQTVLTLGRPEAPLFGVLLATGVVVLYTVVGGQYGLLRTDLWQFWLMLAGFGAALAVCWRQAGGWGGLQASLPPELLRFPANEAMPPGKVMAWLWTVGLPYAMGPDMVSRLLCARDGQTARRAALLTALCLVPLAFVLALLGLAARAAMPAAGGAANAWAALLPAPLAALLAAALLAAMMSSAATCLLSSATIFVVDLLGAPAEAAETVRRTRLAAALIALLATGLALRAREIIPLLLFAYSIYSAGVVAPAMLGFWRRELRLSANGAVAAMVLGGGVALALQLAERPGPWGLVVAVVVLLSWRERPQESLSAGAAKP